MPFYKSFFYLHVLEGRMGWLYWTAVIQNYIFIVINLNRVLKVDLIDTEMPSITPILVRYVTKDNTITL